MHTAIRAATAVGTFLVLQELVLRAVFPLPEVLNFDRASYSHIGSVRDPSAPATLGHASVRWVSEPDGFDFVHALNLYGFRDREWRLRKPDGATRVAFFGDSFVEGFSAPAEATLPAAFAALAESDGRRLDVLNLGIGGGDLPAYARLLRDAVPIFRPDHVVMVLYANDVLPTRFDPAWLRDPLTPELASPWTPRGAEVLRRMRAGLPVPRRWHAPPVAFLPPAPDPRNPWSDGRVAGRLQAFVEPDVARAIRDGRFNPALVDSLPWYAKHLRRPVRIDAHVAAWARHVRSPERELHVVYVPTKNQVSDRYLASQARFSPDASVGSQLGDEFQVHARLLAETCASAGVRFLDLTPALREGEASAGPLYWEYDDHMRAAGYRLAAGRIYAWMISGDD